METWLTHITSFFHFFLLRATISDSWKYFCGNVQRVWHSETVRDVFFLNYSAIGTFSPREFILVFIFSCSCWLSISSGTIWSFIGPVCAIILVGAFSFFKVWIHWDMFWRPYQKSRRSFFSEYSPIYLRIFAINITYHHSLPLRNIETL